MVLTSSLLFSHRADTSSRAKTVLLPTSKPLRGFNRTRSRSSRLSGEVIKRKKKLSKKYYGTSHVLSTKFVFEKGCEQFIIGSGQIGNVHLSPEAEAYFAKKGCKVLLQPTPEAIRVFNKSQAKKIGLFHVTC